MLYVSILTSDRSQDPELWATIWQGQAPPSINLISAYNMGNDKRVFIWEGEVLADIQFMDRFNEVGVLETSPAFDRSAGWPHSPKISRPLNRDCVAQAGNIPKPP